MSGMCLLSMSPHSSFFPKMALRNRTTFPCPMIREGDASGLCTVRVLFVFLWDQRYCLVSSGDSALYCLQISCILVHLGMIILTWAVKDGGSFASVFRDPQKRGASWFIVEVGKLLHANKISPSGPNPATLIHLHIVSGCVSSPTEVSRFYKDYMVQNPNVLIN